MTNSCRPELQALLDACADFHADTSPNNKLRQTSSLFLRVALKDPALLEQAIHSLKSLTPDAIAWFAMIFGSYVEYGGKADITAPSLIAFLREWSAFLPSIDDEDEDLPDLDEPQKNLLRAVPFLCQSIVAHLARLPDTQEALAQDTDFSERLDELGTYSYGFTWVHEALSRWSGPLLILHVPSGKGMRLDVRNVSNCFHLFSLIQLAIGPRLPGGRTPSPQLSEAISSGGENGEDFSDEAWWHYGSALSNTPELVASIWGESNPRSIPCIDDIRIILLWPSLLSGRSWGCGFFGPQLEALPPSLTVTETLSAQACHAWFEKLSLPWPSGTQASVTSK